MPSRIADAASGGPLDGDVTDAGSTGPTTSRPTVSPADASMVVDPSLHDQVVSVTPEPVLRPVGAITEGARTALDDAVSGEPDSVPA